MSNAGDNPFNLDDFNLGGPAAGATQEAAGAGTASVTQAPEGPGETAEKPPRPGLFARLKQTSIFTVMLGLSLLALTIAVIVLAIELSRYQWDTRARSVRGTVTAPGIQPVVSTITAVA
ncbi:MAG: hypothetical protein GYA33_16480 [Thermogutta sp.]|nr:hypothetical protein [Thermogutta sp.]